MAEERGRPDHRHRIVRRKIVQAVVERGQVERVDLSAGRIAGDHVDLAVGKRLVNERQIHRARRAAKVQPVGPAQAGIAIRALEKLVAESRRPCRGRRPQVRDRSKAEAFRIGRSDQDRKGVVEPERLERRNPARAYSSRACWNARSGSWVTSW